MEGEGGRGVNGEGEVLAVFGREVHEELGAVPWLSSARICALITHRVFETMVGRPPVRVWRGPGAGQKRDRAKNIFNLHGADAT